MSFASQIPGPGQAELSRTGHGFLQQAGKPGARPRGNQAAAERPHQEHDSLPPQPERPALRWSRSELAGRLAELSTWGDGAALTLAFALVVEAQHEGEPVAWLAATQSTFYPPDAARCGVDLEALPVVRVADAQAAARAADKLVRSGAFGLVVLDLGARAVVPLPLQSRLLGLAGKHGTAIVFLTEKQREAPSLGSLVSIRAQAMRKRAAEDRFSCEACIVKDKRRGPGWSYREIRHGPAGLR